MLLGFYTQHAIASTIVLITTILIHCPANAAHVCQCCVVFEDRFLLFCPRVDREEGIATLEAHILKGSGLRVCDARLWAQAFSSAWVWGSNFRFWSQGMVVLVPPHLTLQLCLKFHSATCQEFTVITGAASRLLDNSCKQVCSLLEMELLRPKERASTPHPKV